MWLVTNRNVITSGREALTEESFGPHFNVQGPDVLRLARARRVKKRDWRIEILSESGRSGLDRGMLPSRRAFLELQRTMNEKNRNCVFFVHGYNNDLEDVLERCHLFEKNFDVEVIAFSWPADGGGVSGAASYLSDKREAKLSANALDRCFEKLNQYLQEERDPNCERTINLVMHSMGNYLFKTLMTSSVYQGETLLFDNIVMVSADVNNAGHAEWVDRVQFRNRLYVCINQDDGALAASRAKFGEQQTARLGHFARNLTSRHAVYVDFTYANGVGIDHAYFEGDPLRNSTVKQTFDWMFNGRRAEDTGELIRDDATGLWWME